MFDGIDRCCWRGLRSSQGPVGQRGLEHTQLLQGLMGRGRERKLQFISKGWYRYQSIHCSDGRQLYIFIYRTWQKAQHQCPHVTFPVSTHTLKLVEVSVWKHLMKFFFWLVFDRLIVWLIKNCILFMMITVIHVFGFHDTWLTVLKYPWSPTSTHSVCECVCVFNHRHRHTHTHSAASIYRGGVAVLPAVN